MLFLLRHGKDDDSRLGGWSDAALSPEGIDQVQNAAKRISVSGLDIRHIYASDLPRARETADIVGLQLGVDVQLMPAFREINNGTMAGLDKPVARLRYPGIYYSTLGWKQKYPGGESPAMFYERIKTAWTALKSHAENLEGDTILVTHGGVIDIILCIESGVKYTNQQVTFRLGHAEITAVSSQNEH